MKRKGDHTIVMKFGGTSVGSPDSIKQLIVIVSSSKETIACLVVSAFAKVTVQLVEAAELASKGDNRYELLFEQIAVRHTDAVRILITDKALQQETITYVKATLSELESILRGVYLIKEASTKILDTIMSYGELLSVPIVVNSFKNRGIEAEFIDARKLIKTDSNFGAANANIEVTYKNIVDAFRHSSDSLKIVTGFIGSTDKDETTILGRNGSDYSASLIGAALKVSKIEIWTDVDGMLTSDPRKVPTAFTIPQMTYQEAMEMSHFGARVIYPQTIIPASAHNIPLVIRNTFHPEFTGTIISNKTSNKYAIKGISSTDNIALILVQGSGIRTTGGVMARLFGALAFRNISTMLITQASCEYTICFAVKSKDAHKTKIAIESEFKSEMRDALINPPVIQENLSIITIIGELMNKNLGVAGKLFMTIASENINVIAIAQGSSERNISFVMDSKDETKALLGIHKAFFGS